MKIQFGDPDQIVQLVQVGMEVFKGLKRSGTLDDIGKELSEILGAISKYHTKKDIERLRSYEEAGLSREQALRLLEVNTIAFREMLNNVMKGKG